MGLLAYNDLLVLVEKGIIQGADIEQVNSSSIDITLGDSLMVERGCQRESPEHGELHPTRIVDISKRESLGMDKLYMNARDGYLLAPGAFVLAQSRETFHLPRTVSAEYKLKSSMARSGLEHLNAGWCDPGWSGSVLTLELKNMTRHHWLRIRPGMRIGQMVFFRHAEVPLERSYTARGRYNNDTEVTGVKS